MARLPLLLATTVLTITIVTPPAKADDRKPLEVEVGARAGIATEPLGPLGLGIGGRAGVVLRGVYLGLGAIDYLGATTTCGSCSSPPGQTVQQSRGGLLYGVEAGYDFRFSLVTIRPQLGLGDLLLSAGYGDPTPGPSVTSNSFYLEPGVVGLVSFGVLIVGADVGALLVFAGADSALTFHGQIGVRY